MKKNSCSRWQRFTLIELLVVVAIIAILASLLMPALSVARERALLTTELSRLRQTGIAVTMYADDHQQFLPGANNSRQRDHSVVRGRLSPDYMLIDRTTWGCPIAMREPGWSRNHWANYWWWNIGWGGACDVEGNGLSNPKTCPDGNPPNCGQTWADGFRAKIDGQGYSGRRSPEEIVLITDSGGLPANWTNGITSPNHYPDGNLVGKPEFSQSLTLSGLALKRMTDQLNRTWNGGQHTWR